MNLSDCYVPYQRQFSEAMPLIRSVVVTCRERKTNGALQWVAVVPRHRLCLSIFYGLILYSCGYRKLVL